MCLRECGHFSFFSVLINITRWILINIALDLSFCVSASRSKITKLPWVRWQRKRGVVCVQHQSRRTVNWGNQYDGFRFPGFITCVSFSLSFIFIWLSLYLLIIPLLFISDLFFPPLFYYRYKSKYQDRFFLSLPCCYHDNNGNADNDDTNQYYDDSSNSSSDRDSKSNAKHFIPLITIIINVITCYKHGYYTMLV